MRKPRGVPKEPLLAMVTKQNYNETMANITVRNIPEQLFEKLKTLSRIERRSLNNEILTALEIGVRDLRSKVDTGEIPVPKDVQDAMIREVAGKWKDKRSTAQIIKDILGSRTLGRDIEL